MFLTFLFFFSYAKIIIIYEINNNFNTINNIVKNVNMFGILEIMLYICGVKKWIDMKIPTTLIDSGDC